MENKRGKDKESCTNMKHESKDFNGWVVLLPSFEIFVESFLLKMLSSFHCSKILANLHFPKTSYR